ncbi:unnamed protein product [Lactuca saligna]|uniref:Uncharacterized protein n=1 Tax=Lactuca saligna TaxID=75948 RepID=A0AA36A4L3_LACSI|nr:unnamed protein product [Lactuca saligna]
MPFLLKLEEQHLVKIWIWRSGRKSAIRIHWGKANKAANRGGDTDQSTTMGKTLGPTGEFFRRRDEWRKHPMLTNQSTLLRTPNLTTLLHLLHLRILTEIRDCDCDCDCAVIVICEGKLCIHD